MPYICLKEATNAHKHRVEDVEWNEKVSELKDRASQVTNIPVIQQSKPVFSHFYELIFSK
jgi:hypothetical protein